MLMNQLCIHVCGFERVTLNTVINLIDNEHIHETVFGLNKFSALTMSLKYLDPKAKTGLSMPKCSKP